MLDFVIDKPNEGDPWSLPYSWAYTLIRLMKLSICLCRPLSISMGNAIRFLKTRIAKVPVALPEAEAKTSLVAQIDTFVQDKIFFADKEIVKHAVTKIRDGDVLLTHGCSCVVEMILLRAKELGKRFRVVIVDSRPKLEGTGLLRRLLSKNINCTYTHVNATPYIMHEVTRVFLGAASVLANGTVYSRVGTACVAMVAHAQSVPVMICCETYKFHERVQLDSITFNELGNFFLSVFNSTYTFLSNTTSRDISPDRRGS